jgi:hypothetical protein
MPVKSLVLASALALGTALGLAPAEAGGKGGTVQIGAGNASNFGNVSGRVHINQNGNGCRNRCYGDQAFNAGWNNGNTNVSFWPGPGKWGPGKWGPGNSNKGPGNSWHGMP